MEVLRIYIFIYTEPACMHIQIKKGLSIFAKEQIQNAYSESTKKYKIRELMKNI